jgi:FixJ family two-component response regulator
VRKDRPDARIIFMSGYLDGRVRDPTAFMEEECFLQKPVAPQTLLASVRRMLDRTT